MTGYPDFLALNVSVRKNNMCGIYFINGKTVTSIGDLKQHVDVNNCIDRNYMKFRSVTPLRDTECLCPIDPIQVAMLLDTSVVCDPNRGFYTFLPERYNSILPM